MSKPNNSNLNVVLIIIVLILIGIGAFLIFGDIGNSKKLSCNIVLLNSLPTNSDVRIKVITHGENVTIQTSDGTIINKSTYETLVSENGTYTFYAIYGNDKKACTIEINNIDKIPPKGNIKIDSKERNLAVKLTLSGSDDVALAREPYSWDNKTWSSNNTLIVSSNGTYTGYIKDEAGNITKVSYKVTNVGNPKTIEKISTYTNTSMALKVDGTVKSWQSNNSTVVSVDKNGKITSKVVGTATITAILTNGDIYEFVIVVSKTKVTSITLSHTSVKLKAKGTVKLSILKITPTNASCDNVSFSSNNTKVATVNAGLVTAISDGVATITVNCDGIKAQAKITVDSIAHPIVPTTSSYKYEGSTLKYYIQNKSKYYLSYIWMKNPYNQIKKLDANTAVYGKILTDNELNGKKLYRRTVGEMVDAYVSKGIINKSKAVIAFNSSGFYVKGNWDPPSDYYDYHTAVWLSLNEGIVTRNRQTDGLTSQLIIGITSSSDLKIYGNSKEVSERKKIYDSIIADKVKNTFCFNPKLVVNGKSVSSETEPYQRQAICQIDSNNYVMLTTISKMSLAEVSTILTNIGCKTAFNLDGGGSTTLFYRKPNSTASKVKCSENNGTCRQVIEGIYFVEQ